MKIIAIAVILTAFVVAPAVADNSYIGFNVGSNKITDSSPGSSPVDSSIGFGIFGGYLFNQNIAAEATYYNFGDATVHGTGGVTTVISGNVVSVSAVGLMPLNNDFSLMAKLGYASSSISFVGTTANKTDLIYGVGAQYNVSKIINVRFNYDLFKVGGGVFSTLDSTLMSVGAVFKM